MLDHGVWAEVKVGDQHLRLFAEPTHSACRLLSITSLQKAGLRLRNHWTTLSRLRSEPPLMPSNASSVWRIWNCRRCDGRNHGLRNIQGYPFLMSSREHDSRVFRLRSRPHVSFVQALWRLACAFITVSAICVSFASAPFSSLSVSSSNEIASCSPSVRANADSDPYSAIS
jgi:hypothetical protein